MLDQSRRQSSLSVICFSFRLIGDEVFVRMQALRMNVYFPTYLSRTTWLGPGAGKTSLGPGLILVLGFGECGHPLWPKPGDRFGSIAAFHYMEDVRMLIDGF